MSHACNRHGDWQVNLFFDIWCVKYLYSCVSALCNNNCRVQSAKLGYICKQFVLPG